MAEVNSINTLEQILENPNKYGLPTFEQFSATPDTYRTAKDLWLQKIDEGQSSIAGVRYQKYKFKTIRGNVYDCESLAHVERIANQEGVSVDKLIVKPEVRQTETTGYYIEVTFEAPLPSIIL